MSPRPSLSQPLLDKSDEAVTTLAPSEATNRYSVLKGKNMKSDSPVFGVFFFYIKNFMRLSHQFESKILVLGGMKVC